MAKYDVIRSIDELDLEIKDAKPVPFMRGSVLVNREWVLEKTRTIQNAYDRELKEASQLLEQKDTIISGAEAEAGKILSEARREADRLREETNQQARKQTDEANAYAQNIRAGADQYAGQTRSAAEEHARAVMADAQARARQMIDDAKAQADEMVSQTTVLARAQAQAQDLMDGAAQHAQAMHVQTQHELSNLLEQVERTVTAQLDDIRLMRHNIKAMQPYNGMENS